MEKRSFKQKKMIFAIGLILSIIFLLITIAIFATKIFFPYHRVVALTVYTIGWIPFLYSLFLRKEWILQHEKLVHTFFYAYWIHMVFALLMAISLYFFMVVFPPIKSPFLGLSDQEIALHLEEDESIVIFLNRQLDQLMNNMRKKGVLTVDFKNISGQEKGGLEDGWISFIEAMLQLDIMKERYKSFYQLNAATKKDLHRQAFINGYASFLTQQRYALELEKSVVKNTNIQTFLNQARLKNGIESGMFDLLQEKLTDNNELLRLNTGRAYYYVIKKNKGSILDSLVESHLKTIDESLIEYAHLLAKKPLNFLERSSFRLWFPIQKQAAIHISYVRTASRDYHIKPEQINRYRNRFQAGDIFLERREWHATNVGIPGFWTHAALYLGTLDELNEIFKDLPELKGQPFSEYLHQNYPEAHEQMGKVDQGGYPHAIIESKRPGVILSSLEDTANADSLGVLRVKNLSLPDRFKVVTQAFSHLGKPYDFDFNFVTDDALVCSELVYKSFLDIQKLSIEPDEINGRPIVSPNQFAMKYEDEFEENNSQLELILFLDGNEKTGRAIEKSKKDFKIAWQRPKWHIAKDFLNFQ